MLNGNSKVDNIKLDTAQEPGIGECYQQSRLFYQKPSRHYQGLLQACFHILCKLVHQCQILSYDESHISKDLI